MVYAIPMLEDGRCFLGLHDDRDIPLGLNQIFFTSDGAHVMNEILKGATIRLEPGKTVVLEITHHLVQHLAMSSTASDRISITLGYTPDDQDRAGPGSCRAVCHNGSVVEFAAV